MPNNLIAVRYYYNLKIRKVEKNSKPANIVRSKPISPCADSKQVLKASQNCEIIDPIV